MTGGFEGKKKIQRRYIIVTTQLAVHIILDKLTFLCSYIYRLLFTAYCLLSTALRLLLQPTLIILAVINV